MYGDDYLTKDGTCVRDYINVEDLVQAHILALEYLWQGGKTNFFNLGTKDGNTVKEVFSSCEKICKQTIPIKIMPRRTGDPSCLVADNSKAKDILNWQPQRKLDDSILSAFKWEKKLRMK
jgi:UDP-glucose 4-epimerase